MIAPHSKNIFNTNSPQVQFILIKILFKYQLIIVLLLIKFSLTLTLYIYILVSAFLNNSISFNRRFSKPLIIFELISRTIF